MAGGTRVGDAVLSLEGDLWSSSSKRRGGVEGTGGMNSLFELPELVKAVVALATTVVACEAAAEVADAKRS
jgi:hypothetical protein